MKQPCVDSERTDRGRMEGCSGWQRQAVAVAVLLTALALGCTAGNDVPPLERRAQEIGKSVMCPVCPGESIDQSQNKLSAQMRAIVVEKLEQGWTEEQIQAFFVERYGPSVLLEPPNEGFNLMVWLVPPVGLALALAALYLVLRTRLRAQILTDEGDEEAVWLPEEERAKYFSRIDAALANDRIEDIRDAAGRSPDSGRREVTGG